MENLIKQIEELREKVIGLQGVLEIDRKEVEVRDLKRAMSVAGFWDDRKKAIEVSKRAEVIGKEVVDWQVMRSDVRNLEELVALASKEGDVSLADEVRASFEELEKRFDSLEFLTLFSGKYDMNGCIVTIHAGSGGVDAQDWAEMLLRMYLKFGEKMEFGVEVIDQTYGNEAGIKSATIEIKGEYVYGYLKGEAGVHRLVRISPFDAAQARHTSFALVDVIPMMPESEGIVINEGDIKIDTFKSSGPGGQSVNTTDSAVRIVHIPTNTVVTCQSEKSQHQNKESAFKILKLRLVKLEQEKKEALEAKLRGEVESPEWGSQIRSYVLQPYKMVKDHRTKHETSDVDGVLEGELKQFMEAYLKSLL